MAKLQHGDKVIYEWGGPESPRFICVNTSPNFAKPNFLIVCEYGDWSGFRTLADCLNQAEFLMEKNKPAGWFAIVER